MHLDWFKYLAFDDLSEQSQNMNTERKLRTHLEEAAQSFLPTSHGKSGGEKRRRGNCQQ